jgi:hypothetical protein
MGNVMAGLLLLLMLLPACTSVVIDPALHERGVEALGMAIPPCSGALWQRHSAWSSNVLKHSPFSSSVLVR